MPRPQKRSYYALDELIGRTREDFPEGETYAVKRATLVDVDDRGEGLVRLKVIDASPEDYVLDRHTLAHGLPAASADLWVEQSRPRMVKRGERFGRYDVEAFHFAGQLSVAGAEGIEGIEGVRVSGAFVLGELSTGFVHSIEPGQFDGAFQPFAEAAAEITEELPERAVVLPELELAHA